MMNEHYVEWMIERKMPAVLKTVRIVMIILTVLILILWFLFFAPGAVLGLLMIILDFAVTLLWNQEYEFIFVGDDLMIDRIYNRSYRRRAYKCTMKDVEIVAPEHSGNLKAFSGRRPEKSYVFTSGQDNAPCWVMYICEQDAGKRWVRMCFEPDQALLNAIKLTVSPRKFFQS